MAVVASHIGGAYKGKPNETISSKFYIPGKRNPENIPEKNPNHHQQENDKKKSACKRFFKKAINFFYHIAPL
jgi:hypothetical protein